MSTHRDLHRTRLWETIIRLGFTPVGREADWLHQYSRSLGTFWECDQVKPPSKKGVRVKGVIDCVPLNLLLEYEIGSAERFSIRFLCAPPLQEKDRMWTHDVDHQHFSLRTRWFNLAKAKKVKKNRLTEDDVREILSGLLVHPAVHQHLVSPIDNHNIRIGGGIDNPFLFLFHLRYQLCPDIDKRNRELTRLVTLFYRALTKNGIVTANELMNGTD
ncbi:MAG: hypothetical protein A4E65_00073 [Syntrophorhabdus sp. PtaU1.Bin153]|nr:MAG: hypothetical protein A4E65_00073 [Syntrophorhabdus sp. PtaU1.Bin153]